MSKVVRKHGERKQRAYPFSIILYLEKNMQNGKDEHTWKNLTAYLVFVTRYILYLEGITCCQYKDMYISFWTDCHHQERDMVQQQ